MGESEEMKTLVCIEKIGGISGKRISVRLISNISNISTGMFNLWFTKKSSTLFINPSLLEEVLKILDNNKNMIYREDWNFGQIQAHKGYILMEIEYKEGEIKNIKQISLNEGIKYLEK